MRADAAMVNVTGDPSIANFTQTGEHTIARTMPTVG
jgi:hypothetical protein